MKNDKPFLETLFRIITCVALVWAISCTNAIHELIPPADSDIHSFSVTDEKGSRYEAEISGTQILVTVPAKTDVTLLLPSIELGNKSSILPVTLPYIHRAFPSADLMGLAVQINASIKAGELGNWVLNFIRENRNDFSVPPIDETIDFTQPVVFCVVAGQGNYKIYTATVVKGKTENPSDPDNPDNPDPLPSDPDDPDNPDNPINPDNPDDPYNPPSTEIEKKIISFKINEPPQNGESIISDSKVSFTMDSGTDVSALYPIVEVSENCGILPLTQEYLLKIFSYKEMIAFYSGYSTATNVVAFLSSAVKKLDDREIAIIMESDLSLPLDFTGLFGIVPFVVVAKDKTTKLYFVSCNFSDDTAALTSFAITKIRNPGLMNDAEVTLSGNTITAIVTYPVEYQNFKLIPDIVIEGIEWKISESTTEKKLTTEGIEDDGEDADKEYAEGLKNPVKLVPSDEYPVGNEYTATLTVKRGGVAVDYKLSIIYKEDPDTIRSITDFRFLRARNPGIKTTSMASISKDEDTGFISATVLYEGDEPPYELIADFYSPGTCTIDHVTQISGETENNFEKNLRILCTSRNKLFCRLYTVQVTFIKIKNAHAALNYFAFPKHLNPDLSQSAEGFIDEGSGTVYITAKYHTKEKPASLIPEFAAAGNVTVNSILQSSGYSAQDFSRSVYYAVRDVNDWSSDSKMYRISINWEHDEASACAITEFGFKTKSNSSIEKDVAARITERAGAIYALLPKGAGKSELVADFTAQGTVSINNKPQTSGVSRNDFSEQVVYTVTSANGLYTKDYTVSVQEAGPTIYVNAAAIGRNNGTCWEDAYITLDAAFEQAAAYGDAPKEIWIAHNNGEAYTPLKDENKTAGFPLVSNTTIRGGFVGTETSKEERATKARKIEFDVNAKTKKEIRYETNVCAVQTKLYQPDEGKDSHLFHGNTLSGEIVFDGVELEQFMPEKDYYFPHYYVLLEAEDKDMSNLTLTLTDCTVRCAIFSRFSMDHKEMGTTIIQDSDLHLSSFHGNYINASGTQFFPLPSITTSNLSFHQNSEFSKCKITSKNCHWNFGNQYDDIITASFTECLIENFWGYFSHIIISLTDCCLYESIDEIGTDSGFSKIENCEIIARGIEFPITGEFSMTNSIVSCKNFCRGKGNFISCKIDNCEIYGEGNYLFSNLPYSVSLLNSDIEQFSSFGKGKDYGYYGDLSIQMDTCTVSTTKDYESTTPFISIRGSELKNFATTINKCTFNIYSPFIEYPGNTNYERNLTVKNSDFTSSNALFTVYDNTIQFTGNTIKSDNKVSVLFKKSEGCTVPLSASITGNTFNGRWTAVACDYTKELKNNNYDNFVDYDVTLCNSGTADFNSEKITIINPLYTAKGTKYTKKAYLKFTNGEIKNDSLPLYDFGGFYLTKSDVILSNLNLSDEDFPLYADKEKSQVVIPDTTKVFRCSSGDLLHLTNCNITGKKSAPYCNAKADMKIKNSSIANGEVSAYYAQCEISESTIKSLTSGNKAFVLGSTVDNIVLESNSSLTTDDLSGTRRSQIRAITARWGDNVTLKLSNTDFNGKGTTGCAIDTYYGEGGTFSFTNCDFSDYKIGSDSSDNSILYITNKEKIDINGCTFKNLINKKDYNNTAILYIGSVPTVTIGKSTFTGNKSAGNGGAVTVSGSNSEVTITDSQFTNNTCDNYGGAVYVGGTVSKLTISGSSKFESNSSGMHGGAVYVEGTGSTLTVSGSSFYKNTAKTWRGGAICTSAKTNTFKDNCSFTYNKASDTNSGQKGGNAIAIECYQNDTTANFNGCIFASNYDYSGSKVRTVYMSAKWASGTTYSNCKLTIKGINGDEDYNNLSKNYIYTTSNVSVIKN